MNTISYEGVVFTRGAIRLHRADDKSLRRFAWRIMRVRIKESSFCLRALRATLASFRMAAARSALAHVPTTSSAASNYLANGDPVYNPDGDRRNTLDRPRQLWCVEPARSAVSSTFKPNYSRLILARWQGFRRYCK